MSHSALEYVIKRACMIIFWTSAPSITCCTLFWDCKKGQFIFKWNLVCTSRLEKLPYHSFSFTTNSTPGLKASFWFLIRRWLITKQASESTATTLGMCAHCHTQSGWFCKKRLWALVVYQNECRVSQFQAPRLWNMVPLHTAHVQYSLTSFEAISKQLLHYLH